MQELNVRGARQHRGAECQQRAGQDAAPGIAGPVDHEPVHRERGQKQTGEDQQVVRQDRRGAEPAERGADERRHHKRLGIGEGLFERMEYVRVEQVQRVARQLMGDPGDRPGIQPLVVLDA